MAFPLLFVGEDLEAVVGFHAVFGDVETLELLFLSDADADGHLENVEEDQAGAEGPGEDRCRADDLGDQNFGAASVEKAGGEP
jgi:hypothetical protein